MKILLYTHFFPPESGAASLRMKYFAEVLEKYDLQIIAPKPSYPQNKLIKDWKEKTPSQFINRIKHLPLLIPNNRIKFSRVISYFTFMVSSFLYSILKRNKSDVVLCSTPPITTAFTAAVFSSLCNKKLVVDIRDMWPQIGIELGILKNKPVINLLSWIEKYILRRASKVLVTAEGDKRNLVERGFDESKISIIYNGADTEKFRILSEEEKRNTRDAYDLPQDKIILIYFGSFNYGMNDLDTLANALNLLSDYEEKIHFVAAGNGERKEAFMNAINSSISYSSFDSMSADNISTLLGCSDISLIPRKNIKNDTGGNVPVKCFESWACGIPVVLSSIDGTDVQKIFIESGCGAQVQSGNAAQFSDAIKKLISANDLTEIGKKGRDFVIANFDRKRQSEKLISIIENLI